MDKPQGNQRIGICPECDEEIRFRKAPRVGQTLSCPECYADLEVVELNPIELASVGYEDDNWEDDDWSDDEWED